MIWLRVLAIYRPIWQMAILMFYSFYVTKHWQEAIVAVSSACFIATTLTLAWQVSHPGFRVARQVVLGLEIVVACVASGVLAFAFPFGPASLLLLPSLVTYAWLYERSIIPYLLSTVPWILLSITFLPAFRSPDAIHQTGGVMAASLLGLIFALYLAITAAGAFLAFLLQRQRREDTELNRVVQTAQSQAVQLQQLNEQLSEYTTKVYELARAEERNRISGEIHDSVAHRLTALIVQLQASRRFLMDDASIEDAAGNINVCEALAREALDEVRASVRNIRCQTDGDGLDVLYQLAQNYAVLTKMDVALDVAPDLLSIPTRLLGVIYRVLEESLTNAKRHGHATRVQITAVRRNGDLYLQIDDNGEGTSDTHYGFGLSTMSERLRAFGAHMQVQSTAGSGFSIRLKIPLWEGPV